MDRLMDLAKVLRSKNSGPFKITLDILFDNPIHYRRVADSGIINLESISRLYQLDEKEICDIVFYEKGLGIKVTYNRPVSSGTVGDLDVYGAQQHAPLMDILIP